MSGSAESKVRHSGCPGPLRRLPLGRGRGAHANRSLMVLKKGYPRLQKHRRAPPFLGKCVELFWPLFWCLPFTLVCVKCELEIDTPNEDRAFCSQASGHDSDVRRPVLSWIQTLNK